MQIPSNLFNFCPKYFSQTSFFSIEMKQMRGPHNKEQKKKKKHQSVNGDDKSD